MGPFRTTVSTRGVGWSVGIPGFRYGISPTGRRYISVGIPGTGLYGIKYLDRDNGAPVGPMPTVPPQSHPMQPLPTIPPSPASPQPSRFKWWQQKGINSPD